MKLQRKSWKLWALAGTLVLAAVVSYARLNSRSLERDLADLRQLGVPISLEDLRERERGGVPIQEYKQLLVRLRSRPEYGPWARASTDVPGKIGVEDLARTQRLQAQMQPEFDELRSLIRRSRAGISWDWPDGNGWNDENMPQFFQDAHRIVGITRRRMATEFAAGEVTKGLESALDLQTLAEQLQKVPGLMVASRATEAHAYMLQGFANAMQLSPNNPEVLALIERATRRESPSADLRNLHFEDLVWAREHLDKPRLGEIAGKTGSEGAPALIGELTSHQPALEAEVVRKFLAAHKRLASRSGNIEEFRKASKEIAIELSKDGTPSGIAVSRGWRTEPDFAEILKNIQTEKARWALTRAALTALQFRLMNKRLPTSLNGLEIPLDPSSKKELSYSIMQSGFEVATPDGQTLSINLSKMSK